MPLAALLLTPLSDAAAARPVAGSPATESAAAPWAFAGALAINQSTEVNAATLTLAGSAAWATSITERSTGPWTFALDVQRGLSLDFAYSICTPTCTAATYRLAVTMNGTEWTTATLNLTGAGPALAGAGASGSVGLESATVATTGQLTVTEVVSTPAVAGASETVVRGTDATYALLLPSALPLWPTEAPAGATWNTSATAQVRGSVTARTSTVFTGIATTGSSTTVTSALAPGATLGLSGAVTGPLALASGAGAQAIDLTSSDSFALLDGLIPSLAGVSLFATPPATGGSGLSLTPGSVDYAAGTSGSFGLLAAAVEFHPYVAPPTGAPSAPAGFSLSSFAPPTWTIQAQPESAADAAAQFSAWGVRDASAPTRTQAAPPSTLETTIVTPGTLLAVAALAGTVVALGVRWRSRNVPPAETEAATAPEPPAAPSPGEPERGPPRDPFDDLL